MSIERGRAALVTGSTSGIGLQLVRCIEAPAITPPVDQE